MQRVHDAAPLRGRGYVIQKAVETFYPIGVSNPVNWEAVCLVVSEYNKNSPEHERKILKDLANPTEVEKRLKRAETSYAMKNSHDEKLDFICQKLTGQDNLLTSLQTESQANAQHRTEEQKKKAKKEAADKKRNRWLKPLKIAGVFISGFAAAMGLLYGHLSVPDKYKDSRWTAFTSFLEKTGIIKPTSTKVDAKDSPNATNPNDNATAPRVEQPSRDPAKQPEGLLPSDPPKNAQPDKGDPRKSVLLNFKRGQKSLLSPRNDGKLACLRAQSVNRPSFKRFTLG